MSYPCSVPDTIFWSLSLNGLLFVPSFFSSLSSPFHLLTIWFSLILPKKRGFLWKLAWRGVLTQDRFQSMHLKIVSSLHMCLLCSVNSESNNHLFFHCLFSWTFWCKLFHLINLNLVVLISHPSHLSMEGIPLYWKSKKDLEPLDPFLMLVHLIRKKLNILRRRTLRYHFCLGLLFFF